MIALHLVPCGTCGISFAVPREYFDARVADGRAFTCPNACHVRLGVESSTDQMARALGAEVKRSGQVIEELSAALAESRLMVDEGNAEIARLQAAVVHYELGPATAVEES